MNDDDDCQIILQMKKAEGCCDFIVVDSVGITEKNEIEGSNDELKVVYEEDKSGLFFLDTTPQPVNEDEAQKPVAPNKVWFFVY